MSVLRGEDDLYLKAYNPNAANWYDRLIYTSVLGDAMPFNSRLAMQEFQELSPLLSLYTVEPVFVADKRPEVKEEELFNPWR